MVTFNNNGTSVNGTFDLLLPFVIIANLIWLARKRSKIVYASLLLCVISVIGALVMIKYGLTGFAGGS